MKYKLINKQTKEETLCDKITVDGFDYYVSDEKTQKYGDYVWNGDHILGIAKVFTPDGRKVIATNNPNIDIPKVVDEVKVLANLHKVNISEDWSRASFIKGYNKSQETHPFSEEDMIEFLNWIRDNTVFDSAPKPYHRKTQTRLSQEELLQLWKEQKPKTIYYES